MKFAKNVVVAVGIAENDEGANSYEVLSEMSFLNHSTIHFVHVFKTILYSSVIGPSLIYPVAEERYKIEESMFQYLKRTFAPVVPASFEGQAHFKCLFSEVPKQALVKYATEVEADLVIVASRKERGIFESSFAQYVNKHTMADVLILKVRDEAIVGR